MRPVILAAAIAATIACGRSREIISSQSTASTPTTPTTTAVDTDHAARSNEARVRGQVSALTGTCPSLSFTVGATHVTTSATTRFSRAGCSAVVNGANVEVVGTRQSDGSIQATSVEVESHTR
jgi:hypothetical protein